MRKIILTGPESAGKSTLAQMLSKELNVPLVKEYAREYLEKNGANYKEKDLLKIAKGQAKAERLPIVSRSSSTAQEYQVCDTSFLVLKIWSEYRYNRCNEFIIRELNNNRNAIYFLCGVEIPWQADELRENPNDRHELYHIYKKELNELGVEYYELKGQPQVRLKKALNFLSSKKMKNNLLKDIYDPEHFRQQGHELINSLADYLSEAQNEKSTTNNWHFPENELKFWARQKKRR